MHFHIHMHCAFNPWNGIVAPSFCHNVSQLPASQQRKINFNTSSLTSDRPNCQLFAALRWYFNCNDSNLTRLISWWSECNYKIAIYRPSSASNHCTFDGQVCLRLHPLWLVSITVGFVRLFFRIPVSDRTDEIDASKLVSNFERDYLRCPFAAHSRFCGFRAEYVEIKWKSQLPWHLVCLPNAVFFIR